MSNSESVNILLRALSIISRQDGGTIELNAKACYLVASRAMTLYEEELEKENASFLDVIKANAEVAKLNVDLQEQVGELRDALQWAWDNMKFTSYPGDGWEYEFCDVCNAPEWKHQEGCKAEEQKQKAQRLLVDAKVRNNSTAAAESGEEK